MSGRRGRVHEGKVKIKYSVLAPSYSRLATTIASTRLNCRVRNENGCFPSDEALAHNTRYDFNFPSGQVGMFPICPRLFFIIV